MWKRNVVRFQLQCCLHLEGRSRQPICSVRWVHRQASALDYVWLADDTRDDVHKPWTREHASRRSRAHA